MSSQTAMADIIHNLRIRTGRMYVELLDRQGHTYHVECEHAMIEASGPCLFCGASYSQVVAAIERRVRRA